MEEIEKLTTELIKGFVSAPDEVEAKTVLESDDNGELYVIHIKLAQKDVGVCIGVEGKTAEALRRIINLIGYRQTGKRVFVKINAPKLPKNAFNL